MPVLFPRWWPCSASKRCWPSWHFAPTCLCSGWLLVAVPCIPIAICWLLWMLWTPWALPFAIQLRIVPPTPWRHCSRLAHCLHWLSLCRAAISSRPAIVFHCKCCHLALFMPKCSSAWPLGWTAFWQCFSPFCLLQHTLLIASHSPHVQLPKTVQTPLLRACGCFGLLLLFRFIAYWHPFLCDWQPEFVIIPIANIHQLLIHLGHWCAAPLIWVLSMEMRNAWFPWLW